MEPTNNTQTNTGGNEERRSGYGHRSHGHGGNRGGSYNRSGGHHRGGGNSRGRFGGGYNQSRGGSRYSGGLPRDREQLTTNGAVNTNKEGKKIPDIGSNVRIIPLGGVEEVGRNMTVIEHGNDIYVVDAGFMFKDENTPGVDYILPNTKYLEERKEKIRAVFITHGHLDHIGALPYIMPLIGNPPIYTRLLTSVMIKKRQEEFPHLPPLDIRVVEKEDTLQIADHRIRFFSVTHTIPDSMGIIVETPYGVIVHTGDLKLDHDNGIPSDSEVQEYKRFENENVLLMMSDSTNVEKPGFSIPERVVFQNLGEIIKNVKGRIILGSFSSQLERLVKVIEIAESVGKKVVVEGRSMKTNIDIVRQLGMLKTEKNTIISSEEMGNYPADRIVVLATGAQGDEYGALMRAANKTHRLLKIVKGDTIVLSSSIIPGNERSVQKLKDNLSRQGARIIHYQTSDVHSSGHANRDETAWIHRKVHPKFFIPVHGYHYMLRVHSDIARSLGMPEENIVIADNGSVIEIQDNGSKIVVLKESAPSAKVMVDGSSIGDVQDVVLRDRQMLAEDGMFVIVAVLDGSQGKLRKSPDIISRGFVYLKESQELLRQARTIIKKTIEDDSVNVKQVDLDIDYIKQHVTEVVSKFLLQKTAKRPVVIPVILSV